MKNKSNNIEKEIKEWNEFKAKIKEEVNIVSLENYDEDSIIFRILKIDKKKNKESFVKYIQSLQENIFLQTFNTMNNYWKKQIKKEYILIEEIPTLKNVVGIIKDRIKSNKESIKWEKEEFVKYQKELQKEKQYDIIDKLNSKIFWCRHHIERYEKEIRRYEDLLYQLKNDIKYFSKKKEIKNEK